MHEPETITDLVSMGCTCHADHICPTCRFLVEKERQKETFQFILEQTMPENLCETYLSRYEETDSRYDMFKRLKGLSTYLGRQRNPEVTKLAYPVIGMCFAFGNNTTREPPSA